MIAPLLSYRFRWLIFVVLHPFAAPAQSHNSCCFPLKGAPTVQQLGREFQQLRKFREADCCRKSGSRMMEILDRLQDSLGNKVTPALVTKIMGQPDFRKIPDGLHLKLNPNETLMAYAWRENDFLYFVFKDGRLVYNRWFHSYE